MSQTAEQLTYSVPGVSCGHCRAAITSEVEHVAGVTAVDVALDAKRVTVQPSKWEAHAVSSLSSWRKYMA